ncbi:MAG TPA: N-acetylglucosamine-6-phosphate deacetylase [Terriglobales bacterium]|nr:N-acetylglucosamine-6-phosphate deacetylase [Terriglobales bacterium]
MQTILTAASLFTPLDLVRQPVVLVEDGKILQVRSRENAEIPPGVRLLDFGENILAPGFIDIHIHGGAGHDVMESDFAALPALGQFLAFHGVTSYCPTTVTAPIDQTLRALERLASAIEKPANGHARPIGVHLEGPFISHAKRGVHPPAYIKDGSLELFQQFWNAARGQVSVLTIAPEIANAIEVIAEAARRGVCASIGHSNSTLEETNRALQAGARHATHTFNAMRPLDHREPGILGAVLADDRLTADIIADGIHVHPKVIELFLHSKGPGRAVLITDAISATGMGDGRFRLGSLEVEVKGERCESEGRLAGSVLTMDRAVRNITTFTPSTLQTAVRLATLNPARVLGIGDRKGILQPGADADLVVLTPAGEVVQTIIGGIV